MRNSLLFAFLFLVDENKFKEEKVGNKSSEKQTLNHRILWIRLLRIKIARLNQFFSLANMYKSKTNRKIYPYKLHISYAVQVTWFH